MKIHKLIPLLFISFIFSQFEVVSVNIEYNENDSDYHVKKNIIDNLDNVIKEYFSLNNFCQEFDFLKIDLKINLIIESINTISNGTGTTNIIKSHLFISNERDLFYFNKGISFEYSKNKALIFNPYKFSGIESILNFYAFLFTGYELDTWGHSMGTKYINKSLNISSELGNDSNWRSMRKEVEKILDNNMLREARYYYYKYFDFVNSEEYQKNPKSIAKQINSTLNQLYNLLIEINDKLGIDKNTLKFLDSIAEDLAYAFNKTDMNDAIKFLILFNDSNKQIYNKYLN